MAARTSRAHDLCSLQIKTFVVHSQVEFVYDLAISPVLIVSTSSGFELVLGIYGGKKQVESGICATYTLICILSIDYFTLCILLCDLSSLCRHLLFIGVVWLSPS